MSSFGGCVFVHACCSLAAYELHVRSRKQAHSRLLFAVAIMSPALISANPVP